MQGGKTLRYILAILLIVAMAVVSGCAAQQQTAAPTTEKEKAAPELYTRGEVKTAEEAKQLLVEGNQRYVTGKVLNDDLSSSKREDLVKNGQHPFATILTCSDSRVSPEILFDQGLGDVFIIRTAGNVVEPVDIGSIEYGVEHLHTPVLVVMGHSNCGAVKATVEAVEKGDKMEGNIGAILTKIKPSVDKVKAAGASGDDLFKNAENENIKAVIAEIEAKSPVVKELVEQGKLKILGAKYHLDTGQVEWLE